MIVVKRRAACPPSHREATVQPEREIHIQRLGARLSTDLMLCAAGAVERHRMF